MGKKGNEMTSDEILKSFDLLMKNKHKKSLSGSWERKAYKKESKRLREHYKFALSYEKRTK